MSPSVRNKALSLVRKITELRLFLDDFEEDKIKHNTGEVDGIKDFQRYLPKITDFFFDNLEDGYLSPIYTSTITKGEIPFEKQDKEEQKSDILFDKMVVQDKGIIEDLFEKLLLELNSKEDSKLTQEGGGSRMNKMKNMVKKLLLKAKNGENKDGKNIHTQMREAADMNRSLRYFNVFFQIFKYYGVQVYQKEYYPAIKKYLEKGFTEIEHPHVTKAFLVDVIAAFLKTSIYYYDGNKDLYIESLEQIFSILDDCKQIDNTSYFKLALQDALENRDPRRFEDFINPLIDSLDFNSPIKARNIIVFTTYMVESFKWRGLPYASKLINKILDKEEISKLQSDDKRSAKLTQLLISSKNWNIISKLLSYYVANIEKNLGKEAKDPTVEKIYEFLNEAMSELENIENKKETQFQLNYSLDCIMGLLKDLCNNYNINNLPVEFVNLSLHISFFCIQKSVQKDTLSKSTSLVGDTLNRIMSKCLNISKFL